MNKHVKNLIALSITVFFTVLVIQNVQLSETIRTFKLFNVKYSLFLVPFFLLIMTLRAKRWQILLPQNNATFTNIYEVYMTSNLLNIFLPARAGDIFRGCFFGHKYNLSKLQTLGTVAAERILDGLTVVFILVFGICPFFGNLAVFDFFVPFLFILISSWGGWWWMRMIPSASFRSAHASLHYDLPGAVL